MAVLWFITFPWRIFFCCLGKLLADIFLPVNIVCHYIFQIVHGSFRSIIIGFRCPSMQTRENKKLKTFQSSPLVKTHATKLRHRPTNSSVTFQIIFSPGPSWARITEVIGRDERNCWHPKQAAPLKSKKTGTIPANYILKPSWKLRCGSICGSSQSPTR